MEQDSRCGEMAVMFLAGLAVGAAAGLLLAPHSGSYTRRQLQNLAEDVTERMVGLVGDAKDAVDEAVEKGKGIVS
ncbi:MAG: YtxH domain-containing protein [Nitrospira sp.]|nr:YtxH domain-containing protein [Nitrospira sp.]MDH4329138.1 YtxH domain-containing protein [Nitrospira sp.]MDH5253218.1 YtxH domain-containing protein [Nitrospira sp.]